MVRRRLGFALATVLGIAQRGFFIPYRRAGELPQPGDREQYVSIGALLKRHESDFLAALAWLEDYADTLRSIDGAAPPQPRWEQGWFPRLDAAIAYTLVRRDKPQRIVEIGSGHSTRFLARAVADGGQATRITAIDPAPRAELRGLPVELLRMPVHLAGDAPYADLASGDVLFVDSSHILMPGSDVDWVLNRVLPELPKGIRVQFHDIFLPDDYPPEWAWRAYNEQLGVAALIQGGTYRPLFASHYVATRMEYAIETSVIAGLPLFPGARESSLWLEKG